MTRVGIGIGGTFIDLVTIGPEGISLIKLPSVPHCVALSLHAGSPSALHNVDPFS